MRIAEEDRKYMLLGLRIAADFGATIAVPIVLFALIGRWLDGYYGMTYTFTALAFVLAALISAKMITKKAKDYGKEYQALDTKEQDTDNTTKEQE